MLKLINITKDYPFGGGKVEALKGISLEFRKREFVAILGPSAMRQDNNTPTSSAGWTAIPPGDLVIGGRSTKKEYTDADWDNYRNRSIGFVFQSYNLIPSSGIVLANVGAAMTLSGVSKSERRRRAKDGARASRAG